jgi:glutaredoxin
MNRYIILIKPSCPFCQDAISFFEEKQISYSVISFNDQQLELLGEFKKAYEWNTVPIIFQRDRNSTTLVGGYTDLVEHFGPDE